MNWLFWSLLSALFAGATAITAKLGVSGISSNLGTAVRTSVVFLFAWAIVLASGEQRGLPLLTGKTWLFLLISGLFTGLSWLCYFKALSLGEASRVAPIDKLSVAFVILFAALFLGETPSWKSVVGGGLIVAGSIVLALK